jgi:cytochrome c oxidase subunit 4
MADTHETHEPHDTAHDAAHPHPNYVAVFLALVVLTAVSFWTVSEYWTLGPVAGHTLVMVVAVCKAILVAMFFMHLKYDWFKVYFMVVPAILLGTFLVCLLLPDMVFAETQIERMVAAPGE